MSSVPAVNITHTFNGDLAATAKVDAAALDSALGALAAAHNSGKAVLDVVVDNNNRLLAGSVGLAQLDAGVRELLSEASGAVFGATAKLAVATVGTANIVLSGEQTVSGKALVAGDRVLLTAQTSAVENGIWIVATGAWSRAVDLPAGGSVGDGWYLVVAGGTSAGTAYVSTSAGTAVVGTDPLTFVSTGTLGVTAVGIASTDLSVTGSPVTGAGTIGLTLNNGVVTNAKLAQMSATTVKANLDGATATATDVPVATLRTALGTGTPSATTFLRGDGTWSVPSQAYSNFAASVSGGTLTLSATLSTNRAFTFPDVAGTISTLENNQTWTGTNTFNGNTVVGSLRANDVRIMGSGAFGGTVDVATLTADRTHTLPDASGTLALTTDTPVPLDGLATTGITGTLTLTKTGTTARTITIPDAAGTVGLLEVANTWTAAQRFPSTAGIGIGMSPVYALDMSVNASDGIRINAPSGQCNIFLQQGGVTNGYINASGGAGTDLRMAATRHLGFQSTNIGGSARDLYLIDCSTATAHIWNRWNGTSLVESARIDSSGNLGIGTTPTAGNGLLQLASGTTKASGIAFGTDCFIYRQASGIVRCDSAQMIGTGVSFTNGAASSTGTLTNAPAAGNPTKWIPINDNGTVRYIPAW